MSTLQRTNRRLREIKVEIDTILESVDPTVREMINQLRQFVQTALPEANERPYPFFEKQVISYHYAANEAYICFISFFGNEVRFAFEHGDKLEHPDLCDTGTFVRFFRFYAPSDIKPELLLPLLQTSAEHARTAPFA